MDNDEARFILKSFRPDGADAQDPDFAEALKLAIENRELGEWLSSERALDSAFANAMGSLDLPNHLRADILACLAGERKDFPQADNDDASWIGALSSIQPPASFRDELIAAMDKTATAAPVKISIFRRAAVPLAAAAGIALAFLITEPAKLRSSARTASAVPIEVVQAGFLKTFESPSFHLEEKRDNPEQLVKHLKERRLPCFCSLPPGLEHVKAIGCRELVINGKRGSLVCFEDGANGVVHMVIFHREDVSGEFSGKKSPEFQQTGNWASARWEHKGKVFLVLSDTNVAKLTPLF